MAAEEEVDLGLQHLMMLGLLLVVEEVRARVFRRLRMEEALGIWAAVAQGAVEEMLVAEVKAVPGSQTKHD